ncbi:unnamed protein product [Ectocarpus sp. 6 AP-2014]
MTQANGGSVPIEGGEGVVGVVSKRQQQQQQTCPHREAAISMLPQADPTDGMSCDSCNKDIKFLCYIRCAECKDVVDLCVSCFFSGSEPRQHKKTHSYRVMDKLHKPIYSEGWSAVEELALADLTRKRGLGAWEEIADLKMFYRRKSEKEVNARYLDTYLATYDSVLPPHYLREREDGTVEEVPIPPTHPERCPPSLRGFKLDSKEVRSRTIAELGTNPRYRYEPSWQALAKKQEMAKAAARAAAAASEGNVEGSDGIPTTGNSSTNGAGGGGGGSSAGSDGGGGGGGAATGGEEGSNAGGGAAAGGAGGEMEEVASKTTNNRRKRRRVAQSKVKEEERLIKEWADKLPGADLSVFLPLRGDFDHEHDNAAEELLANMEFRPTDHASERQLKLDVIAVYNHRLDEREKRKRFVIEHNLLDYKKQQQNNSAGRKRHKDDRELIAKLRPLARFSTPADHEELIDNLLLAKKMRMRIEQLQVYRQNGITTLAEGAEFEIAKKKRQEELASKKHRESASYLYEGVGQGGSSTSSKANIRNIRDRNNRYSNRQKDGGGDGGGEANNDNLLDISGAPGVEYLSPAERVLCSQLHLLPGYYLVIKNAMIQECARAGCLKKKRLPDLAVLDTPRLNKMYDFFSTLGWVTDKATDFTPNGSSSANGGLP